MVSSTAGPVVLLGFVLIGLLLIGLQWCLSQGSPLAAGRRLDRATRFDAGVDSVLLGDFPNPVHVPAALPAEGGAGDRWRKRAASSVILTQRAPGLRNLRHTFEPIGAAPVLGSSGAVPDGVVGRGDDVKTLLDHARTSRRHADLAWSERGWRVRDLASTNGTLVNGIPISGGAFGGKDDPGVVLRPSDVITFGDGGPSYVVRLLESPHFALTERAW